SLHELRAAAEARHDSALAEWLRARGLEDAPRLASRVHVESGWETAVERALGARLAAGCVERFDDAAAAAGALKPERLALLETTPASPPDGSPDALLGKARADFDPAPLHAGVRTAPTLDAALARRTSLAAHESIVTPDGAWVGRNWLSLEHASGSERGWLARQREIERLEAECAARAGE